MTFTVDEFLLSEIFSDEAVINVNVVAPGAVAEVRLRLDVAVEGVIDCGSAGGIHIETIQLISLQRPFLLSQTSQIGGIDKLKPSKRIRVCINISTV